MNILNLNEYESEKLIERLEKGSSKEAKKFIKSSIKFYEKMKKKQELYNIILEGCDGVGKSSIFEELMHRGLFGKRMIGIRHPMPPKSHEEGKRLNHDLLKQSNHSSGLVFDRHILSERVYAPIMRNYYPHYIDDLEKQLKPYNVLFLITADLDVVEKRFDGKGITLKLIPMILKDYKYYYEVCHYPLKFMIDTSNITPYQALQKIEEYLMR